MPQFTIDQKLDLGKTVGITGGDAHHITDVLRLKKGDWIVLSDGKGNRYKSVILSTSAKTVRVHVEEKMGDLISTGVTLAQAVIKHSKTETIIQKAVELGVTTIIPFISERTIPKFIGNRSLEKTKRWNKIADEAAKQCGIPLKPEVKPIINFQEMIQTSAEFTHKLMFYEGENQNTINTYFNPNTPTPRYPKTIILIGPEGGFTTKEVDLARRHGFTTLKLGPLIMRVETAALSAITLVQYILGHFDN